MVYKDGGMQRLESVSNHIPWGYSRGYKKDDRRIL